MARVTIEDCLTKVENRFRLVLVAAQRARDIIAGSPKLLPNNNDKEDVVSLREIGAGLLDIDKINEAIVIRHQKHQKLDADDVNDSSQENSMEESTSEQESGNQDSIITNMYEEESYGDAIPEGEMMGVESEVITADDDDDDDDEIEA